MVKTSWVVTLTPLVIALLTTVKSFITGEDLSPTELELIKYLVGAFVASGAIGAYNSKKKSN